MTVGRKYTNKFAKEANRLDWTEAACRGMDPNDWVASSSGVFEKEQIALLRSICASCLIVRECGDRARQSPSAYEFCFMAGKTPRQRRTERHETSRRRVLGLETTAQTAVGQ